jgi:hypothetical protein
LLSTSNLYHYIVDGKEQGGLVHADVAGISREDEEARFRGPFKDFAVMMQNRTK